MAFDNVDGQKIDAMSEGIDRLGMGDNGVGAANTETDQAKSGKVQSFQEVSLAGTHDTGGYRLVQDHSAPVGSSDEGYSLTFYLTRDNNGSGINVISQDEQKENQESGNSWPDILTSAGHNCSGSVEGNSSEDYDHQSDNRETPESTQVSELETTLEERRSYFQSVFSCTVMEDVDIGLEESSTEDEDREEVTEETIAPRWVTSKDEGDEVTSADEQSLEDHYPHPDDIDVDSSVDTVDTSYVHPVDGSHEECSLEEESGSTSSMSAEDVDDGQFTIVDPEQSSKASDSDPDLQSRVGDESDTGTDRAESSGEPSWVSMIVGSEGGQEESMYIEGPEENVDGELPPENDENEIPTISKDGGGEEVWAR